MDSHKSAAQSECVLCFPLREAQVPRVEAKELLDFFAQDAQVCCDPFGQTPVPKQTTSATCPLHW